MHLEHENVSAEEVLVEGVAFGQIISHAERYNTNVIVVGSGAVPAARGWVSPRSGSAAKRETRVGGQYRRTRLSAVDLVPRGLLQAR